MGKSIKVRALLVIVVLAVCFYLIFPVDKAFTLGPDLQGGTHFTVQVMTDKLSDSKKEDAVESAVTVIRTRIDELGIAATRVERAGIDRIFVQVPGADMEQVERIREILTRIAHLEFRIVIDGPGTPIIEELQES